MTSSLIDTHAHIYLDDFKDDHVDVMARCKDAGIEEIYMPNIDHTSIDQMMEIESRYPGYCLAMIGLHPCSVKKGFEKELYKVEEWLGKRTFIAVGEIGTDLYWDKTFWEQQEEAFRVQVRWAAKLNLPVVIHCRNSLDKTIELLEPLLGQNLRGVFHCFSGTLEQAAKITTMGFYLGLGGVTTFKNGGLDLVVPSLELDNIILETDSPYLAPAPHRGKRNEPSYLPLIATKVAGLKQVTEDELRLITTRNAKRLFLRDKQPKVHAP